MQSTNAICQQNWKTHITQQETGGHDVQPISNIFVKIGGGGGVRGENWGVEVKIIKTIDYIWNHQPVWNTTSSWRFRGFPLNHDEKKNMGKHKICPSLPNTSYEGVLGMFWGVQLPHHNVLGSLGLERQQANLAVWNGDFQNNIQTCQWWRCREFLEDHPSGCKWLITMVTPSKWPFHDL